MYMQVSDALDKLCILKCRNCFFLI